MKKRLTRTEAIEDFAKFLVPYTDKIKYYSVTSHAFFDKKDWHIDLFIDVDDGGEGTAFRLEPSNYYEGKQSIKSFIEVKTYGV